MTPLKLNLKALKLAEVKSIFSSIVHMRKSCTKPLYELRCTVEAVP